jgi:hypothetical protein
MSARRGAASPSPATSPDLLLLDDAIRTRVEIRATPFGPAAMSWRTVLITGMFLGAGLLAYVVIPASLSCGTGCRPYGDGQGSEDFPGGF